MIYFTLGTLFRIGNTVGANHKYLRYGVHDLTRHGQGYIYHTLTPPILPQGG